jgi:hypothetical protein
MKGYMSNLGPHLGHNRHHTLLLTQEQPCSEFDLHMHDQQPTHRDLSKDKLSYDSLIRLYGLTTCLFICFTKGKNLNKWHPKIVTDPCRSLATNPVNLGILLQSTTNLDY